MKKFEVSHLKLLHKKQKDKRAADNIKAIVLLGTGWTLLQVSEALLLDTEALRDYVKKYRDGKIDSEYTYSDIKSILVYVRKEFGVTYKSTTMRNIVSGLGVFYTKPKLVLGNSDPVMTMNYLLFITQQHNLPRLIQ